MLQRMLPGPIIQDKSLHRWSRAIRARGRPSSALISVLSSRRCICYRRRQPRAASAVSCIVRAGSTLRERTSESVPNETQNATWRPHTRPRQPELPYGNTKRIPEHNVILPGRSTFAKRMSISHLLRRMPQNGSSSLPSSLENLLVIRDLGINKSFPIKQLKCAYKMRSFINISEYSDWLIIKYNLKFHSFKRQCEIYNIYIYIIDYSWLDIECNP